MGDDNGLFLGGYCARISVTDASMILSYFDIRVGVVVGRDVLVAALCLG